MSDFLTRLAARALGIEPSVSPRLPPRFAPLAPLREPSARALEPRREPAAEATPGESREAPER